MAREPRALTYRDAGVDIDAGNRLVTNIKDAVHATHRAEMLGGLGGFAALTKIPGGYREPVLVTGTDGVGTKLKLAIDHDRHDHVGQDLVAMCVNDVLVCGAEPFLFLDYYATGALEVDTATRVVKGIAAACSLANCSLGGGETAEMPGFYGAGDYDLAGFCVGVVEADQIITGDGIDAGDVLLGLASSGPHSNGYSLVRRVIDNQQAPLGDELLDSLLAPTRIYVRAVLPVVEYAKGMCHITGGGFTENLPRIVPPGLEVELDLDSWQRPSVFSFIQQAGNVAEEEMLRTFNLGIGFIIVVAADDVSIVSERLIEAGEAVTPIGKIVAPSAPARGLRIAGGD